MDADTFTAPDEKATLPTMFPALPFGPVCHQIGIDRTPKGLQGLVCITNDLSPIEEIRNNTTESQSA